MEDNKPESSPQEISISPEFYQLLKTYTNSNDPLEDPNFDIAAYLNEKFPDFKSLEKLPFLIEDFEKQISELDEEIDGLMCERAKYNEEMKTYMTELNNDVGKIIELINSIKQNTDTNETTVKMICNDIRNLDNARNNITTTIMSLTKLIMLITGIEKLESFVKEKMFKDAANAIAASNAIMEYFKEYKHVTQVNSLYQKKDNLCSTLLSIILDEFKNNIELLPNNSERLYEACLAINEIGNEAIMSLKTWFTQYKLMPYESLFDPKAENAVEFKETERRFEWIKRCLKEYDKLYDDVFPPSWGFKSQICQEFCRITKLQLNDILTMNSEGIKKIEVEVLVKVLNNTNHFERNLHEYLLADYPENNKKNKQSGVSLTKGIDTGKEEQNRENMIDEIKAKYSEKPERNPNRKDPNDKPIYKPFRVLGVISESFEPFMASYVDNEEKKIKEIIINLKKTDRIEGKLYVSSLYLFNNIKQAMNRCLSISKSKTFLDLCVKFKDILKFYNDNILKAKFTPIQLYINNNNNTNTNNNSNYKLTDAEIESIVYVINTTDYCITTVGALTQSLKEKIEEKYAESISYDDIVENFRDVYKSAFDSLSLNFKNLIIEQLNTKFIKQIWTLDNSNASSESPFKLGIIKVIQHNFSLVQKKLQEEFICHYFNIIPKIIIEAQIAFLYKIKRMDHSGAEKLLADVAEIEGEIKSMYHVVIKAPQGQGRENDLNYNCLLTIITKEFGKMKNRLKCLGSTVEEIGNAYKSMVDDKSKEDFDKMIAVRGIKKSDIADYEKIFI